AVPTTLASWPLTGLKRPSRPWRWRAVARASNVRLSSIQRRPSTVRSRPRRGSAPFTSVPARAGARWRVTGSILRRADVSITVAAHARADCDVLVVVSDHQGPSPPRWRHRATACGTHAAQLPRASPRRRRGAPDRVTVPARERGTGDRLRPRRGDGGPGRRAN